jgi:DNA-binding response OmpR family regulator
MASYLESGGYRTVTAGLGQDAIRLAREGKPAAITLDMLLPGKTGWEILHDLKASAATATIPVVIVSVIDERKMGLAMGAADYLIKPISQEKLLAVLRHVIPRSAVTHEDDSGSR